MVAIPGATGMGRDLDVAAMTETTDENKRPPHLFKPGQSGNPAGRPLGARHKLGEAFIEALREDFEKEGKAAIVKVRTEKPDAYLKVIASLLPKDVNLSGSLDLGDTDDMLELDDATLNDIIRTQLAAVEGERRAKAEAAGARKPKGIRPGNRRSGEAIN